MLRYPWPASGVNSQDMRLLYHAREGTRPRIPITQLVAEAVRQAYGQAVHEPALRQSPDLKVAA